MKKHFKYLWYVLRHKWFVFLACKKEGLFWQGVVHDLHKFSRAEWKPYVEMFYGVPKSDRPIDERVQVQNDFNAAWEHHYTLGKHHWNHWIEKVDNRATEKLPEGHVVYRVERMPEKYWREMLCDWRAMSRANGGNVEQWYGSQWEKLILHPATRIEIEIELEYRYYAMLVGHWQFSSFYDEKVSLMPTNILVVNGEMNPYKYSVPPRIMYSSGIIRPDKYFGHDEQLLPAQPEWRYKEDFFDAIRNDPEMSDENREYWLSLEDKDVVE